MAERAVAELRELLGDRLSTSPSALDLHGRDESSLPPSRPDAVAFPRSTPEAVAIVAICARHGLPVIPFGAGSSLEGHVLATRGGVTVDMQLMDEIRRVSVPDLDVTVQAGVRRRRSSSGSARTGCFSASTRERMPRLAAWRRPGRRARTRFATARCARTCSIWRWSWRTAA
jgi:D-lactate dehydrogenase (cytochrome)